MTGLITRLRETFQLSVSDDWAETGNEWHEYETVWEKEYAAKVTVYHCMPLMNSETGEVKVKRKPVTTRKRPLRYFDEDGYFEINTTTGQYIPPNPNTEKVVNPENERDCEVVEFSIRNEDISDKTHTND